MRKLLLIVLLVMLALPYSTQAQDTQNTSIYVRLTGGVDNQTAFTGSFAVGTETPLGQGFTAVSVIGYAQFDIPSFQMLGNEEQFYLSGLVRKELFEGVAMEGGGALGRLDYSGDDETPDTYLAGYIGLIKTWKFYYFSLGVAGGVQYLPAKADELGTTTFLLAVQGSFEIK